MDPTANTILIKFAEDDHQLVGEAVLMAIRQHGASLTQPAGCSLWQNGGKKQRQCPVARTNTNIKLCTWRTWTSSWLHRLLWHCHIAPLFSCGQGRGDHKASTKNSGQKIILASLPSQQNIKCKNLDLWGFYLWRYDEHHHQSPRSCQLCTAWHMHGTKGQGSEKRKKNGGLQPLTNSCRVKAWNKKTQHSWHRWKQKDVCNFILTQSKTAWNFRETEFATVWLWGSNIASRIVKQKLTVSGNDPSHREKNTVTLRASGPRLAVDQSHYGSTAFVPKVPNWKLLHDPTWIKFIEWMES